MKIRWNEIENLPVYMRDKSEPIGRLKGVFMDPDNGRIIAFMVGVTKVLSPVDVEKWDKEGLWVQGSNVLVDPKEILRIESHGVRRTFLNAKKVVSKSGKNMGRIRDFTMDTPTNSILDFSISKGFFGIEFAKRIFSYKDISKVTDRSVILSIDPEATRKLGKDVKAHAPATGIIQ